MAIPGIQEIQALATKYSKPQLQKMAQMGLVDPTKAVMAGMMIDRIQQQNMQPPQQTVAEEVMGAPPPPAPAAPEGAPPPGGIAGLPSNLPPQMAGGGIVAFAEGGDTEDYADGGAVRFDKGGSAGIIDIVDPNWTSSKSFKRNYTNDDKFALLAEQLAQLTAAERQAQGVDKIRIQKDIAELQSTMRGIKASPAARSLVDKIPLPGAGAAEPNDLPPISSPSAKSSAPSNRPKSSTERLMEEQVREDIGYTDKPVSPEVKKASEESAARALERQAKQKELRQLEGGFFEQKPLTDEQAARAAQLRQEIESFNKLPPIAPPRKDEKKAEPAPAPLAPETKPAEKEAAKVEKAEMGPARPSAQQRLENQLASLSDKAGKELTADEVLNEQDRMFERLGVSKDFFTNLRRDYESTRGKFTDRAEKAAGHAMMMFGAGLMGARQGEFFSTASKAAQQSLMMYMSSMDKISEQEEKLNKDLRDLNASEEQYKRSRATSALEAVQKNREKVADRQVQIAELENRGLVALTNAAVERYKAENPTKYMEAKRIAEDTGKSIEEVIRMLTSGGAGSAGSLADKAYDNVMKRAQVDLSFQMQINKDPQALQAAIDAETRRLQGGGTGGGGATYNYVPGKGLVPTQ